jgi:flavodoxin I
MKVLIVYLSESGNTEKLAKAIFEGTASSEKEMVSIKDVAGIEGYDVIFIGFPVQSHSVPVKVEAFAKTLPDGQKVAYFATHGSMKGGEMAVTAFHHALTISKNAVILGTFGCRGQVKQSIVDALLQKAEHRGWALEAQGAAGHPDAADFEDGKDWARKMITKARAS